MKVKLLLATLVVVAVANPALAASYYVVQNSKTQKCSVATTKPSSTSKTSAVVGDGTAYKTKDEATTAMTTADACKPKT
jgi:hypothetical protein